MQQEVEQVVRGELQRNNVDHQVDWVSDTELTVNVDMSQKSTVQTHYILNECYRSVKNTHITLNIIRSML